MSRPFHPTETERPVSRPSDTGRAGDGRGSPTTRTSSAVTAARRTAHAPAKGCRPHRGGTVRPVRPASESVLRYRTADPAAMRAGSWFTSWP